MYNLRIKLAQQRLKIGYDWLTASEKLISSIVCIMTPFILEIIHAQVLQVSCYEVFKIKNLCEHLIVRTYVNKTQ